MKAAWIVLCAAFVVLGINRAVSSMFAILILPVQSELESGRATVTFIFTVHLLAYSIASLLSGLFIDRLGPRVTIALGGLCMGGGLMLMTAGHTLPAWVLTYGLLCGTGVALAGMPANYVIISDRYPGRVATATAIAGSGMGVGVLAFVPLVQWNADRLGWRTSTLWAGLVVAVVVIACTLVQASPRDREEPRGTGADEERRRGVRAGIAAALKKMASVAETRQWQGFALANFLMGAAIFAVLAHQVAAFSKIGWSAIVAATSLGAIHLLRSLSSPVWGAVLDRGDRRRIYGVSVCVAVLGIVSLVVVEASSAASVLTASLFVAAFGVGSAGTMPTNASLGNELFSARERGIAWGMTEAAYAAGAAIGAWSAGRLFDLTGNYMVAFSIAALELVGSYFVVRWLSPARVSLAGAT